MDSLPTVLVFTPPEHGQANVNLATSYELALAGVNVCVASFASLRTRVSRLQELVVRHSGGTPTGSVTFHEFKGVPSLREAADKRGVNVTSLSHPHGVSGALKSYPAMEVFLFPWGAEEHLAVIEACKRIIAITKPNVVVADWSFYPALDACKLVDQKFVVISPNSIKDIAIGAQPHLAALWKYPAISSGYPFPLKWWQIPLNIYLNIRLAVRIMTSENTKQVQALRASLGLDVSIGDRLWHGAPCICPALIETDFPFAVVPEPIILCGPIVMPCDPLEESDPALKQWLDNGPTVMINLGSHTLVDAKSAMEMATALRILLDYHAGKGTRKFQILWKAKPAGDIQTVIDEIIGKEIEDGKVKVLAWLEPEPISILQHPNLVCTVHHGGANSFYEGVWSGIPHVVLPVWYDTYDYARRAEFLNIGVFGNETCAPSVRAEELSKALVRVTGDTEEAARFRMSAKQLKELCRGKGNGRERSSAVILMEIGIGK